MFARRICVRAEEPRRVRVGRHVGIIFSRTARPAHAQRLRVPSPPFRPGHVRGRLPVRFLHHAADRRVAGPRLPARIPGRADRPARVSAPGSRGQVGSRQGHAARGWRYNVEALHFLYGGLLSAYVVLYFRSSTGARPALFLALLVGVMGLNEVPRIRRAGYTLRLGLYGFCVLSFLTYFIPIVLGRIDGWVFLLSLLSSAAVVWQVTRWLACLAEAQPDWRASGRPAAPVCARRRRAPVHRRPVRAPPDPARPVVRPVPGHLSRRPPRGWRLHARLPGAAALGVLAARLADVRAARGGPPALLRARLRADRLRAPRDHPVGVPRPRRATPGRPPTASRSTSSAAARKDFGALR